MDVLYPPDPHYLRDLSLILKRDPKGVSVHLPVTPPLCDEQGILLAGVLATAIDIGAGSMAGRLVAPDWVATSDISLHVLEPVLAGGVVIEGRLVRQGRSLVVIELRCHSLSSAGTGQLCAQATAAFSVLASRGSAQGGRITRPEVRAEFPRSEVLLSMPILEKLGIKEIDAAQGVVEIALTDYVRNTFGALQGGLAGLLSEAAIVRQASIAWDRPAYLYDLRIRYLTQGNIGPFRTDTEVLRASNESSLTRVSFIDTGAADRLVTLASGSCRPL